MRRLLHVGLPRRCRAGRGQLTIPQTYDLGLVHITQWVAGTYQPTTYGEVAPVGYLDELAAGPEGAGERRVHRRRLRPPVGQAGRVRAQAADGRHGQLREPHQRALGRLEPALLEQSGPGPRRLRRRTCFGDSGGPVIEDGYIVAVNSFVLNNNCNGAGFGYRVDTELASSSSSDSCDWVGGDTWCRPHSSNTAPTASTGAGHERSPNPAGCV